MKPLLMPFVLVPLLAACDPATLDRTMIDLGLMEQPEPEVPVLPPAVAAVMPPGTPPSSVTRDATGCYIFSIERTDPQTGFYVRGRDGQPICAAPEGAAG